MVRIAYHSVSPLIKSGYGRCTAELVYRLADAFDIDIYAYFGLTHSEIDLDLGGPEGPRKIRVVGNTTPALRHEILETRASAYRFAITHSDAWAMTHELKQSKLRWIWWVIGDHSPVPMPTKETILMPNLIKAVPMSRWFYNELLHWKECPKEKIAEPIYHGIDLDYWKPYDECLLEIPKGTEFFIVTVAANHGFRENLTGMLEGFAIFLKKTKANAYYYIHAEPIREHAYNLINICRQLEDIYGVNLKGKIAFKESRAYLPDEFMKSIYTHADCHLLAVMGGSFELPLLEAGACGCPNISTNFSAPAEILGYGERGILIGPKAPFWLNLTSSRQYLVDPNDIASALQKYYENPDLRKEHADKMLKWIRENATWDLAADRWKKLLRNILKEETFGKLQPVGAKHATRKR